MRFSPLVRHYEADRIAPVMNQVECHPFMAQRELLAVSRGNGVRLTAYSPLGAADRPPRVRKESAPAAYFELHSIGLTAEQAKACVAELCGLAGDALGVGAKRIYLNCRDAGRTMWGWNGDTFG